MQIGDSYRNLVQVLSPTYGVGEARSMSRIVFEDVFKIFDLNSDKVLSSDQIKTLEEITKRLLKNEPLQYILGAADFYGLRFAVDERVLIPRPETEELVDWILKDVKSDHRNGATILDIGTGSGCIPITLKKENPSLVLYAVDFSEGAVEMTLHNALKNEVNIDVKHLDILNENNWGKIPSLDIIVSNPPYIPFSEKKLMPQNVLENEPHMALFVENNEPLIFYIKIAELALQKLNPKGLLYFETNEYNAEEVKTMLISKGFESVEIKQDMSGKDRMIKAGRKENK